MHDKAIQRYKEVNYDKKCKFNPLATSWWYPETLKARVLGADWKGVSNKGFQFWPGCYKKHQWDGGFSSCRINSHMEFSKNSVL